MATETRVKGKTFVEWLAAAGRTGPEGSYPLSYRLAWARGQEFPSSTMSQSAPIGGAA